METSNIRTFLQGFYEVAKAYVVGDNPVTTFSSCGAVLLASILAQTRSVDILATITGFPPGFIGAVLRVMETGGYHLSLEFADLIMAACLRSDDFGLLENSVDAFMEIYWARMDPVWRDEFEILRERRLFGGQRQGWIDAEHGPPLTENERAYFAVKSLVYKKNSCQNRSDLATPS